MYRHWRILFYWPLQLCDGRGFRPDHGFGWRMSVATLCSAAAAASNRTLVLHPQEKFLLGPGLAEQVGKECVESLLRLRESSPSRILNWPSEEVGAATAFGFGATTTKTKKRQQQQQKYQKQQQQLRQHQHQLQQQQYRSASVEAVRAGGVFNDRHNYAFGPYQREMPPHVPLRFGTAEELWALLPNPVAWYLGMLTTREVLVKSDELDRRARERAGKLGIDLGGKEEKKEDRLAVAAIHVRRGFDGDEAPEIGLGRYFTVAEELFKRKEIGEGRASGSVQRRVAVFTDSIAVARRAKKEFPGFQVMFDEEVVRNAAEATTAAIFKRKTSGPRRGTSASSRIVVGHNYGRFGNGSAVSGIVTDVLLMAAADFFVGTCSSNIGRLVFQLRAAEDPFGMQISAT